MSPPPPGHPVLSYRFEGPNPRQSKRRSLGQAESDLGVLLSRLLAGQDLPDEARRSDGRVQHEVVWPGNDPLQHEAVLYCLATVGRIDWYQRRCDALQRLLMLQRLLILFILLVTTGTFVWFALGAPGRGIATTGSGNDPFSTLSALALIVPAVFSFLKSAATLTDLRAEYALRRKVCAELKTRLWTFEQMWTAKAGEVKEGRVEFQGALAVERRDADEIEAKERDTYFAAMANPKTMQDAMTEMQTLWSDDRTEGLKKQRPVTMAQEDVEAAKRTLESANLRVKLLQEEGAEPGDASLKEAKGKVIEARVALAEKEQALKALRSP